MREVIDENLQHACAQGPISDDPLVDLIRQFLVDTPDQVELILKAVREQDFSRLEQGALILKDRSGILGALELHATCERLEAAGRRRDAGAGRELGPTLRLDFEEAFGVLENLLESYG